jgi:putative DNA primase/helicase
LSKRAVERLLSISGGDPQNINPKGRTHYTVALPCKLMLASNIVPNFDDPTGALLARLLFVESRVSFVGREDPELLDKILTQQNEITWWFLRGLRRLLKAGRYTEPQNNLRAQFQSQNAPVQCFVATCCELSGTVQKDALHDAFLAWCDERQVSSLDKEEFYRQLYASYKTLSAKRARQGEARVQCVEGISLKVLAA